MVSVLVSTVAQGCDVSTTHAWARVVEYTAGATIQFDEAPAITLRSRAGYQAPERDWQRLRLTGAVVIEVGTRADPYPGAAS